MDTIGDFLTVIRNASTAKKQNCSVCASNIRVDLAGVLKKNGFIRGYSVSEIRPGVKEISLQLKYVRGVPAITGVVRCSRPGCRLYCSCDEIPNVYNNLGICILTTSKGILSGSDAKHNHVGGELLCKVW
ncbi:MAG: 30S ribosomal protein S8 [Puniceicoccales bacterium]|jgi:small subunit ribosomal protein S8|nr:30S ribosomal protein S8 [Puniceicoccales bacterium]